MNTNTISFEKKGIKFDLEFNGGRSFKLTAENLWESGDAEFNEKDFPVKHTNAGYENGQLKFGLFHYMKIGANKVGGVKVEDPEVIESIEKLITDNAQERADNKKDREDHRTAPYADFSQVVGYNIGCDTGMIYAENAAAIKLALENGAQSFPLLRGDRDESNKYPGQMDANIPSSYATKIDGEWKAEGYRFVYEESYFINKADYDAALEIIEKEKKAKEDATNEELNKKFEEAKSTGKPVLISKYVVAEQDSPLAADGEGDMVDICKYAMPDGTTEEKYFHNY